MDNRRKVTVGIVVAAVCILAAFLFRTQPQEAKLPAPEEAIGQTAEPFGVIDVRRAMQAHPKYQELQRLRQERSSLEMDLRRGSDMKLDAAELEPMPGAATEDLTRQKYNQAVEQKLQALNERLQQAQQEILQAHAAEQEAVLRAVDDRYLPEIFNLQLKLSTLKTTPEAAAEIQGQIQAMKSRHAQETSAAQQAFQNKIFALMEPERDKARQEMDAYAAEISQTLREEARQRDETAKTRNHLAALEQSAAFQRQMQNPAQLRAAMEEKERAIAALADEIDADIGAQAAKFAVQHKLSIVLAKVQVNVRALDITDFVIDAFKK